MVVRAAPVPDGIGRGGFESVRGAWSELEGSARHFFQTPEWIQPVALHTPGDVRFGVLREDGRPVAASVLVRNVRRCAGMDFTILHNGVRFSLIDGLVDPAMRDRITVAEVADVFGRWDVLHLLRLRVGSPWLDLADSAEYMRAIPGQSVAVLDTSMAFEERWAQMPKKLRASIRTARNRIDARGGAGRIVATHDDVAAAFDQHVALEVAGWKGRTRGAALAHAPRVRDSLSEYFRASDTAQVHTLHIDGRLAASICGTVHAGTFGAISITYDERLSKLSPGSVLLAAVIASCCSDPTIQRIDCLAWPAWLERWAFEREPIYELLAFNRGLRGGVAKMAYRMRSRNHDLRERFR